MKAPQIILCVVYGVSLLSIAYMHGKEKTGKYNLLESLVCTAVIFGLLIWGGFFNG